jgi:hypothetical protein
MPSGDKIQIVPYHERYQAQVLALAHEMHAESPTYASVPFNDSKFIQQCELSMTMPDSVYLRLAVIAENVVGGFWGIISGSFFSDEIACKDLAWFVTRTRRGSIAALHLIADFEQWGLDHGVRKFYLSESTGVQIEKTAKLYEHLAYMIVGMVGVKTVQLHHQGDKHVQRV